MKALILEEVVINHVKIDNLCNMRNKSTIYHYF
jgi:hypothetical protein